MGRRCLSSLISCLLLSSCLSFFTPRSVLWDVWQCWFGDLKHEKEDRYFILFSQMASPYTKSMYLLVISEWEIAARSLPCNIKCLLLSTNPKSLFLNHTTTWTTPSIYKKNTQWSLQIPKHLCSHESSYTTESPGEKLNHYIQATSLQLLQLWDFHASSETLLKLNSVYYYESYKYQNYKYSKFQLKPERQFNRV